MRANCRPVAGESTRECSRRSRPRARGRRGCSRRATWGALVKAAQYNRHGPADVLEYVDEPDPEPGPGEVLIAVRATALNRLDLLQREGPPLVPGFELPHIAGMDIAGDVIAVGPDVHGIAVGARVIVNPSLYCGWCDFCRRGDNAMCPNGSVIGASRPGGYAELVVAPETHVYPIPDTLSYVDAATIPTAFST